MSSVIADVRPALENGIAVQLRYSYRGERGERWCDTILPGMTDTLLVRVREPISAMSSPEQS